MSYFTKVFHFSSLTFSLTVDTLHQSNIMNKQETFTNIKHTQNTSTQAELFCKYVI